MLSRNEPLCDHKMNITMQLFFFYLERSRLFNYYVAGLQWSFNQPPYMNGIYYGKPFLLLCVHIIFVVHAKSLKKVHYQIHESV